MIKAYILDANFSDLNRLCERLLETKEVDIVGNSIDPYKALDELYELQPDVLFLDLHLPGLHGIMVAERVKKQLPDLQIVIVTENRQFALSAFERQVADYVLKPVEKERLNKTIARLKMELGYL